MEIERVIALGLVICTAFLLGLIAGRIDCHKKNKSMREELERLRNWKESTKVLCDKLQDGEDNGSKSQGKAGLQYEIVTHGNPREF